MRDGFEETIVEHPRPRLTYPFERGPKIGEALDVAPGVKWLRMPLGGSLAFSRMLRQAWAWWPPSSP